MDIEELWQKAVTKTEIYRARIRSLHTFAETVLPYVCLAESSVNEGDVVVRKGKIVVQRPVIFLPGNIPQLEGFDIESAGFHLDENDLAAFLILRGISFPTMKYSNQMYKLDVMPGPLSGAIGRYKDELEKKEDVSIGLIISPEECWKFSVLIYAAALIGRSLPEDIRNILRRMDIRNN